MTQHSVFIYHECAHIKLLLLVSILFVAKLLLSFVESSASFVPSQIPDSDGRSSQDKKVCLNGAVVCAS